MEKAYEHFANIDWKWVRARKQTLYSVLLLGTVVATTGYYFDFISVKTMALAAFVLALAAYIKTEINNSILKNIDPYERAKKERKIVRMSDKWFLK